MLCFLRAEDGVCACCSDATASFMRSSTGLLVCLPTIASVDNEAAHSSALRRRIVDCSEDGGYEKAEEDDTKEFRAAREEVGVTDGM